MSADALPDEGAEQVRWSLMELDDLLIGLDER